MVMLHYILDKKNDGKPFEKPTAQILYEKLIAKLKFENVKWQQAKAKMNNFRLRYVEVKKWLDRTGKGVDFGTIEGYKTAKCPFFDLLDGIYGDKASITIPYLYDSLNAEKKSSEENGDAPRDNGQTKHNEMVRYGVVIVHPDDTFPGIDEEQAGISVQDLDSVEVLSIIDVDNYYLGEQVSLKILYTRK